MWYRFDYRSLAQFRHDLSNSGAATDSGYPATAPPNKLRMVDRSLRSYGTGPADSRGPSVVDRGMVITAGSGVIQANDQFTGSLLWAKYFLWQRPIEPAGAPANWCYNDIPQLEGNTGVCYVANLADCPSWCFKCTTTQPDCIYDGPGDPGFSLISPLPFPAGYDQILTGPTMDPSYPNQWARGTVTFGTFDGRVISLKMTDGSTIWERKPYRDPGGPNVGKPWYNQKFAWHLSPPSAANGKLYVGSFLASFYAIFRPWAYVGERRPLERPMPLRT